MGAIRFLLLLALLAAAVALLLDPAAPPRNRDEIEQDCPPTHDQGGIPPPPTASGESSDRAASVEIAVEGEQKDPERAPATAFLRIVVTDMQGQPIAFEGGCLQLNDQLKTRLLDEDLWGADVLSTSVIVATEIQGEGAVPIEAITSNSALVIFSDGYAPLLVPLHGESLQSAELRLNLARTPSMQVEVVGEDGAALSNARVIARESDLGRADAMTLDDLIRSRLYQEVVHTGDTGVAVIHPPPELSLLLFVEPRHAYSSTALWDVAPTSHFRVECRMSYSVTGRLVDAGGTAVPNGALSVLAISGDGGEIPLATTTSNEAGEFNFLTIPATNQVIQVVLHEPGWYPVRSEKLIASPAGAAALTLVTESATGMDTLVVDTKGNPLGGHEVQAYTAHGERLPTTLRTTSSGQLRIPAFLPIGSECKVEVEVGGTWITSEPFTPEAPAEGSEIQRLVIAGVGRVMSVKFQGDGIPGGVVTYQGDIAAGTALSGRLLVDALPAHLPEGSYLLSLLSGDTAISTASCRITEGEDVEVAFDGTKYELRFELPHGGAQAMTLYSQSNAAVYQADCAQRMHSISLPPGRYYFSGSVADGTSVDVGPFTHRSPGTQLGMLDIQAGATICGIVNSGDGRPLCGITVYARSPEGFSSLTQTTSESGAYSINGLPSGEYEVVCFSSALAGDPTSRLSKTVFVGARAVVQDCNFTIPVLATTQIVATNPPSPVRGGCVLLEAAAGTLYLGAAKEVSLPTRAGRGTVVLWGATQELLWIAGTTFSCADPLVSIPCDAITAFGERGGLPDLDEPGSNLRLVGSGFRWPLQPDQVVKVSADAAPLLQFVPSPTGSAARAPDEGSLIRVEDTEGRAVPSARVNVRGTGCSELTDTAGMARVQAPLDGWIWVDHSAYWATQVQRHAVGEVVVALRRSTSTRRLEIPQSETVDSCSIRPSFSIGYSLPSDLTRSSDLLWLLPELPEGNYTLELRLTGGDSVELNVTLRADGAETLEIK